jgi:hypothetical protein
VVASSTMKDTLEIIAKILVLAAGICYVVGLLVVNIHLSQYGFYSLSLLQLNYVTAGVWALLPMFLPIFVAISFATQFYEKFEDVSDSQDKKKSLSMKAKMFRIGAAVFVAVACIYTLIGMFVEALGLKATWSWILVGAAGALAGFFMFAAAFYKKFKSVTTVKDYVNYFQMIFIAIIGLVAYTGYFARSLYKEIPASVGGGRPHQVRLVVEKDNKPYLESAGLLFSEDPNKSDPAQLILSTDKEYILKTNQTAQAISIPSNVVKVVVFERTD